VTPFKREKDAQPMTRTSETATVTIFPESSICEMETLIREPASKISGSAAAGQYKLSTASILEDPVALETEEHDVTGVVSNMQHGPLQVVGTAGSCQPVALCLCLFLEPTVNRHFSSFFFRP
jgi:hypothetical protein